MDKSFYYWFLGQTQGNDALLLFSWRHYFSECLGAVTDTGLNEDFSSFMSFFLTHSMTTRFMIMTRASYSCSAFAKMLTINNNTKPQRRPRLSKGILLPSFFSVQIPSTPNMFLFMAVEQASPLLYASKILVESLYFHFLLDNFQQMMVLEGWFGAQYLITTQCFSFLVGAINCSALNTDFFALK